MSEPKLNISLTNWLSTGAYVPDDTRPDVPGVKWQVKGDIYETDLQVKTPDGLLANQANWTLLASYGCNIAQVRQPGDTNSIRFVYPRDGEPLIDTEKSGTNLNISATGDLNLCPKGVVRYKGEDLGLVVDRIVLARLRQLLPDALLNKIRHYVDVAGGTPG